MYVFGNLCSKLLWTRERLLGPYSVYDLNLHMFIVEVALEVEQVRFDGDAVSYTPLTLPPSELV